MIIDGGTGNVGIGTTAPTGKLHVQRTDEGKIFQMTTPTTNVNVQTATGEHQYLSTNTSIRFGAFNQQDVFLVTNNTSRLHIEGDDLATIGNVGIGTTTPGEKLEVNGTIKATDINFTGLPEFADDTAAGVGGLVAGDVYKTATGELRIKL